MQSFRENPVKWLPVNQVTLINSKFHLLLANNCQKTMAFRNILTVIYQNSLNPSLKTHFKIKSLNEGQRSTYLLLSKPCASLVYSYSRTHPCHSSYKWPKKGDDEDVTHKKHLQVAFLSFYANWDKLTRYFWIFFQRVANSDNPSLPLPLSCTRVKSNWLWHKLRKKRL